MINFHTCQSTNVIVKATELNNKNIKLLQIGASSSYTLRQLCFYYKLGQTLLQIVANLLLQIGASVVTNWGSYYKLGQPLLQNRAAITNWGKMYHKLGQVLQMKQLLQSGA